MTATLSTKGHALTLEQGAPQYVAKALASTHSDPTALVRGGFADLTCCPAPEYRYVVYTRPGAWADQWMTVSHHGREMFAGAVGGFVEEYGR
jgi:hypothetical protein